MTEEANERPASKVRPASLAERAKALIHQYSSSRIKNTNTAYTWINRNSSLSNKGCQTKGIIGSYY
jgi:hypothetical protein